MSEAFWYDVLDALKNLIPYFFISLLVAETIILLIRFRKIYYKESFINLFTGGLSFVLQALIKGSLITGLFPEVYKYRIFDLALTWQAWALGILLYCFLQFAIHFIAHKVRFFWCMHEVHHSAINMNITTGLRTSIFDIVSLEMSYLIMPLLGFHPVIYFLLYIVNKFWGTFIHISEHIVKNIPILDWFMVTPGTHHIHHARNIPYLDKNYGELVPWFDKVFGTYATEIEPIQYGTLTVQEELGFWESQTHEFKKLFKDVSNESNWWYKLGFIFGPPGWQPNDYSRTTKALQKQQVNN
jgi:sterol desaturase/sphingolipid hydroxylase (fatty acid hydroxylase superfamily)